jgi:hypothetical protein
VNCPDWVVINYAEQPPILHCEHCGQKEPMKLPQKVKPLCLRMEAFANEHLHCHEQRCEEI